MKALVLAGGRGNRLNELSREQNKCMIKIQGKHLIQYNLDHAVETGVDEIVIVVGYRADSIMGLLGDCYHGKPIRYVIQREQNGLVHAIECAQDAISGEDFFLMLGDEMLFWPKCHDMINKFKNDSYLFGLCGIVKARDKNQIKKTYNVIKNNNNRIFRLIEKPRRPLNHFQGTGHCVFRNDIFSYIKYTPIHHERNEKELPDLVQCAVDDGMIVEAFFLCEKYTNINTPQDLKMAEDFFCE